MRLNAIIGAGVVAAVVASGIAVTSGSAQAPAGRTLDLVETQIDSADVLADVPPLATAKHDGPSKGDSLLFRKNVFDATGARKLGTLAVRCTFLKVTRTFIGSQAICDGIYSLSDGTITVAVSLTVTKSLVTTFAVTGGTGAYDGARGTGTSTGRSSSSNTSDVVIALLP